ncbi:slipin family protein [candidate division KSB1 bacterium]|nr:slipin family protein [candidate division KSB1 bacterium]
MTSSTQISNAGHRVFAQSSGEHVSLGGTLRAVLFLIPFAVIVLLLVRAAFNATVSLPYAITGGILFLIFWQILVGGIRIAAQWERGVVLRLGNFHSVRGPGLFYVIPILENVRFIDTRTLVLNIPRQKVITRDNVPAEIDGALFFMVSNSEKAVISIQDFRFAVAQYAQAALRDVVGGLTLDELLSEREQIQIRIREHVEERVKDWGLHVDSIRLQDIELPEDLKRMMSRQASAEREKRATITKAEGDKLAAVNLLEAAKLMEKSPFTLQLRTLQTIDGLGAGPSNTVVLFPAELANLARVLNLQPSPK